MANDEYRAIVDRARGNFREVAVSRLRGMAVRAMDALEEALDAGHPDRTRIALEVLDRVGLPRGVSHDVTVRQAPVDREALAEWVAAKIDATDEE